MNTLSHAAAVPRVIVEDFQGRVAFVTGAGSGIGAEAAKLLARGGASVIVSDLSEQAAVDTAVQITSSGGSARSIRLDVTDADAVCKAIESILRLEGGLDLAVNSAGITTPLKAIADSSVEEWRRVISVNLDGLFHCLRAETSAMLKRGRGAIVNLASIMGIDAMAGASAYAASKHGVVGLTKAAALDYATVPIRVNAVAPGYVDTPLLGTRGPDSRQRLEALHPMRRIAQPMEVAAMIAFLLSDRAGFATGSVFSIDGGYSAR